MEILLSFALSALIILISFLILIRFIKEFNYLKSNKKETTYIKKSVFYKEKCPICNSKIDCDYSISYECKNGCYSILFKDGDIKIFDERFSYLELEKNYTEIYSKIRYWRENNRYLMRILTK